MTELAILKDHFEFFSADFPDGLCPEQEENAISNKSEANTLIFLNICCCNLMPLCLYTVTP